MKESFRHFENKKVDLIGLGNAIVDIALPRPMRSTVLLCSECLKVSFINLELNYLSSALLGPCIGSSITIV